eukprot:scaffold2117_cov241-Pinguiococcus_pyrenoidosus.AAC.3
MRQGLARSSEALQEGWKGRKQISLPSAQRRLIRIVLLQGLNQKAAIFRRHPVKNALQVAEHAILYLLARSFHEGNETGEESALVRNALGGKGDSRLEELQQRLLHALGPDQANTPNALRKALGERHKQHERIRQLLVLLPSVRHPAAVPEAKRCHDNLQVLAGVKLAQNGGELLDRLRPVRATVDEVAHGCGRLPPIQVLGMADARLHQRLQYGSRLVRIGVRVAVRLVDEDL